jgi:hypothetical protein
LASVLQYLQHLAVNGDTQMVTDGTLMVGGGTQMSDGQHRLGSTVTGMTPLRHH